MTFSLVGRCASGALGVVVCSSSPAVAARCAHARAGVGAVATQNVTDPRLGPALLDLLAAGVAPEAAIWSFADRPGIAHRQLMAIGAEGQAAAWSGASTLGVHGSARGRDCAAAGNLLGDAGVPGAMVAAFEGSAGALAGRLMAALAAGLAAGGEAGPVRSAGLLVVRREAWPVVDLRVDWDEAPVARLGALLEVWAPQMEDYVRRALDPDAAPAFG